MKEIYLKITDQRYEDRVLDINGLAQVLSDMDKRIEKLECDCLLPNGLLKSKCFNGCPCKCHQQEECKHKWGDIEEYDVRGEYLGGFLKPPEPYQYQKCEKCGTARRIDKHNES